MVETPESSWVERLPGRLRHRPVPPRLLDGYARRVMERIAPTCPWESVEAGRPPAPVVRWRWDRPLRWELAPAAAVATGVLIWAIAGGRATSLSHRAVAQAMILERLDDPWSIGPADEELLAEDARQVDRFLLAQVPSTTAASAELLATLLNQLDEEPLDTVPDAAPEDWLLDLADSDRA